MTNTLKKQLNKLSQEVINRNWVRFEYSVEARVEYELSKRFMEGTGVDFHPYSTGGYGVLLPTDELAKLIWVPKPFLELDADAKRKGNVGIWFLSGESNCFIDDSLRGKQKSTISDENAKRVDWAMSIRGEEMAARWKTERNIQLRGMDYGKAHLLNHMRRDKGFFGATPRNVEESKLDRLVWGLMDMYAGEMGLTLPTQ